MARTCDTCGRSWGARATFCGGCGDLLDDHALATVADGGSDAAWWRHPALVWIGVVVVVVGAAAAVPSLSLDRTGPVDGEVGVPERGQLQAAPADVRVRRSVDPPPVACRRDDVEVDCVAWSRALSPPPGPQDESGAWVLATGDRILVASDDRLEAADASTGTRLWQLDPPGDGRDGVGLHPAGFVSDGGLVVTGRDRTAVVELGDGTERWSVDAGSAVWGFGGDLDLVLIGRTGTATGTTVVAHDAQDGHVAWQWQAPWSDLYVVAPPGTDRLVLISSAGDGLAVLDRRTGDEVSRTTEISTAWLVGASRDVVVVATTRDDADASPAAALAGDPGATLRGIDLSDGGQRWERDVRAGRGVFEVAGGMVVAPSTQRLTALDAGTGEVLWDVVTEGSEVPAAHPALWGLPPAGPSGPLPVLVTVEPSRSVLRGRDPATGAVRWEQQVDDGVQQASVEGDDVVVFTGGGFHLHDTTTGEPRLQVPRVAGSLVAVDPLVLHHHQTGHVTRLDPDGTSTP